MIHHSVIISVFINCLQSLLSFLLRVYCVLVFLENAGHNTHFLLCTLIKHLDHKNVLKNPEMQIDIIEVATSLARITKVEPSVTIVGAFSDMMRHLRKSIHCSIDDSNLGEEVIDWNKRYRAAVDECLVQLSHKVKFCSFSAQSHIISHLLYHK